MWGHPHITPLLTALLPLSVHPHITLLLTALLPLSVHPLVTPILTALLPLSTANDENGPRQAERHEGSHAQQLGQLANGRAGNSRRPVYKEAFQPTRVRYWVEGGWLF